MEDKKDEVTILSTDIEQPQKEDNKQNNKEQKQQNKDDKKKTLKTVIISCICTLLFIIILLLLILLGLKKCNAPQEGLPSNEPPIEEPIDTERNNKMTNVFKTIVSNKMGVDGFDSDELKNVIAVTYDDSDLTKIKLDITVTSETKVYYYSLSNYDLPIEENTYTDIVSYLLLDATNLNLIEGDASLDPLSIDKFTSINTDKTCKYVISKNASDDKHLSGFYKDETKNEFYVYQKILINEGTDPFNNAPKQTITKDSPLHNYYRGLCLNS